MDTLTVILTNQEAIRNYLFRVGIAQGVTLIIIVVLCYILFKED
jgi:hypothetical protein